MRTSLPRIVSLSSSVNVTKPRDQWPCFSSNLLHRPFSRPRSNNQTPSVGRLIPGRPRGCIYAQELSRVGTQLARDLELGSDETRQPYFITSQRVILLWLDTSMIKFYAVSHATVQIGGECSRRSDGCGSNGSELVSRPLAGVSGLNFSVGRSVGRTTG